MKVLIAYDGSKFANDAIEDLPFAGLPERLEALILTVTDVWELPEVLDRVSTDKVTLNRRNINLIREQIAEALDRARALAGEAEKRVREMFPEWDVRTEACTGKPAWEIIKKAHQWKSDLIVVGSHGRTGLGRVLLGSVSQKVLNEAHCSVRIARKPVSDASEPVRVLLAFDGSDCAETAARTVAGRSWQAKTKFRIITADDNTFSRPEVGLIDDVPPGKKDSPAAVEWIKKMVEKPVEILQAAGKKASQRIRWGEARSVILDEARDWQANTIFVGARGLGRFKKFLIGSVSSAVAAKAKCSVEVVRRS